MPKFVLLILVLTLSAAALICAAPDGRANRVPVLLELFTSEGCSSCPPADRLLQAFDQNQPVAGADLIVLSEHVDYWDHDGWKDPFSSAQNTARQQQYANKFHLDGVYTPQLVVDGQFGVVGSDAQAASSAIAKAIARSKIPVAISNATRAGDKVAARIEMPAVEGVARSGQAVLYVALADDRTESQVMRGENSGRLLTHVAVVRVLREVGTIRLGNAYAGDISLKVQSGTAVKGLRLVAFLQDAQSGHVVGVAAQKL